MVEKQNKKGPESELRPTRIGEPSNLNNPEKTCRMCRRPTDHSFTKHFWI